MVKWLGSRISVDALSRLSGPVFLLHFSRQVLASAPADVVLNRYQALQLLRIGSAKVLQLGFEKK